MTAMIYDMIAQVPSRRRSQLNSDVIRETRQAARGDTTESGRFKAARNSNRRVAGFAGPLSSRQQTDKRCGCLLIVRCFYLFEELIYVQTKPWVA